MFTHFGHGHFGHGHPLLVGLGLLMLALLTLLAAAPDLSTLDFSLGRDGVTSLPPVVDAAAPAAGEPAWVAEPLRTPGETLRTPAG